MPQLSHSEYPFTKKTFPVILVCDHIMFQPNIGSLFRICEAFGVEHIIFIGKGLAFTPRKIGKTSRSTHLTVSHNIVDTTEEAIQLVKDHYIVALELTTDSTPLRSVAFETGKPIALLAGSEISGISDDLLKSAHQTVHIEMFGANSSMNVVQAVAIALYDIISKIS